MNVWIKQIVLVTLAQIVRRGFTVSTKSGSDQNRLFRNEIKKSWLLSFSNNNEENSYIFILFRYHFAIDAWTIPAVGSDDRLFGIIAFGSILLFGWIWNRLYLFFYSRYIRGCWRYPWRKGASDKPYGRFAICTRFGNGTSLFAFQLSQWNSSSCICHIFLFICGKLLWCICHWRENQ